MQSVRQGARSCVRRLWIGPVAVVLVAACGSSTAPRPRTATTLSASPAAHRPGAGKPAFTLGTKNFTEEFILGQLYAQALRAKGYTVTLKNDLGPSEVMDRKLTSGAIDGYPEYTGTILAVFGHNPRRPVSALQAYQLASGVERARHAALLAMAPATDTDVLVAKPAFAASHGLKSLGDLASLGSSATLAGPPEFRTRTNGMLGLIHDYKVTSLRFLPEPIGMQYQALAAGRAQLAVAFTTDGKLTRGGFALLSDPKNIFGFQNVTFLVREGVLSREGPAFAQTINAVSARLSTEALRLMNAAVSLDQQSPAAVARQFLGANGLL
jgi:osmoprotectant transport system substrate-binding protein